MAVNNLYCYLPLSSDWSIAGSIENSFDRNLILHRFMDEHDHLSGLLPSIEAISWATHGKSFQAVAYISVIPSHEKLSAFGGMAKTVRRFR
jgi:hypothetical protein